MTLFSLFEWWGKTPVATVMNGSELAFPLVETLHMIGIVLVVGTAALVDVRLLGLRFTSVPVSSLASQLGPWTLRGLGLILITGLLLLSTDPDRYYYSCQFRFKMACLLAALLFDGIFYRKIRSQDQPSNTWLLRVAACTSLVLWSGVVAGGRAIGVLYLRCPS